LRFYYRTPGDEQVGEPGSLTENIEWHPLTEKIPPFDIDAVIVFSGSAKNDKYEKTLLRYGRPVLRVGWIAVPDLAAVVEEYRTHLGKWTRTNYQPIDCNFYDNFEAAIVQRRYVELEYLDANGEPVMKTTLLRDLKTHLSEEFVQLASGEWLRLDQIVSVDGLEAGASCRF
jgi:Rho-binding antiterminator